MTADTRAPPPPADVATTLDAFLGDRLTIAQPARGYRAGIDAVLLAASVPAPTTRDTACRVLDCGAGVGTVGLCVAARIATAHVVLLEREPVLAALARDNVARNTLGGNGLGERVRVVEAAIGGASTSHTAAALAAAGLDNASALFDHAIANPPYHTFGRGTAALHPLKAASHAMPADDLDIWVRTMVRVTRPGGRLTLIHTAAALPALLAALDRRTGGLRILPIHPREGAPAHRVIVRGTKGSRAPAVVLPGLVLHGPDTAYLPAAEAIFRRGLPLCLETGHIPGSTSLPEHAP